FTCAREVTKVVDPVVRIIFENLLVRTGHGKVAVVALALVVVFREIAPVDGSEIDGHQESQKGEEARERNTPVRFKINPGSCNEDKDKGPEGIAAKQSPP